MELSQFTTLIYNKQQGTLTGKKKINYFKKNKTISSNIRIDDFGKKIIKAAIEI